MRYPIILLYAIVALILPALGADFSFIGAFAQDDERRQFTFTVARPGTVEAAPAAPVAPAVPACPAAPCGPWAPCDPVYPGGPGLPRNDTFNSGGWLVDTLSLLSKNATVAGTCRAADKTNP